ncbi:antA/AntB antirepressor family protein [Edwardsiella piscicida]|uniref:antA/AntB antirepressor family protein n=1 Tax=Edwardsiella piscicida TaxID=1263550 RepID=UPI00084CE49C|nr:antA/AntB antirepressor family protein [Edwardsiella piscicida]AOP42903.1 antA/AntB antirepressor family protein [Edwardsiella piscicida]UCQ32700.1 antA/AntB antirepressor family protein [Edwardsiella piscicida]UCQ59017.1 antA/AntB antirepressor family protein [Edwardsiella piscicida]
MTTQLIPIFNGTISNEPTLLCNARDLHEFLGVGKRFASWVTERITEYEFVENQDYIIISQNREIIKRGRPTTDYHLTLDTAKELAMVERNERGRQIRRYFIECERQLLTRQQGAYSTPKPQQLSDGEIKNLKWLIDSIVNPFRFRAAWNQGVWYALRQATGVPSPYPFTAADLPALARELQRIMEISHETRRLIQQLEKQVLQQVVRNRGELRPVLNHIQHEFRQLSLLGETRSQLNNVERQSLARLTRRAG